MSSKHFRLPFFFFMDKIYIYGTVIFLFTEQSFLKLGLLQIGWRSVGDQFSCTLRHTLNFFSSFPPHGRALGERPAPCERALK